MMSGDDFIRQGRPPPYQFHDHNNQSGMNLMPMMQSQQQHFMHLNPQQQQYQQLGQQQMLGSQYIQGVPHATQQHVQPSMPYHVSGMVQYSTPPHQQQQMHLQHSTPQSQHILHHHQQQPIDMQQHHQMGSYFVGMPQTQQMGQQPQHQMNHGGIMNHLQVPDLVRNTFSVGLQQQLQQLGQQSQTMQLQSQNSQIQQQHHQSSQMQQQQQQQQLPASQMQQPSHLQQQQQQQSQPQQSSQIQQQSPSPPRLVMSMPSQQQQYQPQQQQAPQQQSTCISLPSQGQIQLEQPKQFLFSSSIPLPDQILSRESPFDLHPPLHTSNSSMQLQMHMLPVRYGSNDAYINPTKLHSRTIIQSQPSQLQPSQLQPSLQTPKSSTPNAPPSTTATTTAPTSTGQSSISSQRHLHGEGGISVMSSILSMNVKLSDVKAVDSLVSRSASSKVSKKNSKRGTSDMSDGLLSSKRRAISVDSAEKQSSAKISGLSNDRSAKRPRKSSSSFRGVSWHKRDKAWIARVWANGKTEHVGVYPSEVRAALAVDQRMLFYKGEDISPHLNFPDASVRERLLACARRGCDPKYELTKIEEELARKDNNSPTKDSFGSDLQSRRSESVLLNSSENGETNVSGEEENDLENSNPEEGDSSTLSSKADGESSEQRTPSGDMDASSGSSSTKDE